MAWRNGRGGWCSRPWPTPAVSTSWPLRPRRCRRTTATTTCRCWERFYRSHRPVLFTLVDAIELEATSAEPSVVDAVEFIRAHRDRRSDWIPETTTIEQDGQHRTISVNVDAFAGDAWRKVLRDRQRPGMLAPRPTRHDTGDQAGPGTPGTVPGRTRCLTGLPSPEERDGQKRQLIWTSGRRLLLAGTAHDKGNRPHSHLDSPSCQPRTPSIAESQRPDRVRPPMHGETCLPRNVEHSNMLV